MSRAKAASPSIPRSTPRTSAPSARPVGITSIASAAWRSDVVAAVNVISASSLPYPIESIAPSASPATGMTTATRLSLSRRRGGAAAVTQLEIEVAPVDEHAERLAQDENRVADIQRIGQQQRAAANRKKPKRDRHHHFSRAFRGDPLHQESHGEHNLRDVAEQHPPLKLGHKDFVQVTADRRCE